MKISFDKNNISKKDYNLIASNLILSQKNTFTYDSILNQLKNIFDYIDTDLKVSVKKY